MLMVDADKIASALDYPRLVEALRIGHQRGVDAVERLLMSQARAVAPTNHLLIWPAWQHGDLLGAKLASVFPGNELRIRVYGPSTSSSTGAMDGRWRASTRRSSRYARRRPTPTWVR